MLTFFRRIRKGLLNTGATRKYLLYAVAEIALVVIGILIALQINEWNNTRENRVTERYYVTRIANEVKNDIEYFENLKDQFNTKKKLTRIIDYLQCNSKEST